MLRREGKHGHQPRGKISLADILDIGVQSLCLRHG
jgi:hypothetical protein